MYYFFNIAVLFRLSSPYPPYLRFFPAINPLLETAVPYLISSTRFYSTTFTKAARARLVKTPVVLSKEQGDSKLHPWFITGFADGESSFSYLITENKNLKTGWTVIPRFKIGVHAKDKPVLIKIKKFLGASRIYKCGPIMVILQVQSLKELERVINHLEKYPLITKKHADYVLFKKIFKIMKRKEHLIPDGLRKIVALKAAMNLGLSEKLKQAFPPPDVVEAERPHVELPQTIDPY